MLNKLGLAGVLTGKTDAPTEIVTIPTNTSIAEATFAQSPTVYSPGILV